MCHSLGKNSLLVMFPFSAYAGLIPGELVVLQKKKELMRYFEFLWDQIIYNVKMFLEMHFAINENNLDLLYVI